MYLEQLTTRVRAHTTAALKLGVALVELLLPIKMGRVVGGVRRTGDGDGDGWRRRDWTQAKNWMQQGTSGKFCAGKLHSLDDVA